MADNMKKNPYEDMLDMPYPFPTNRPRMSMYDRAAQFGSFAALTGHEEAIEEKARFTSEWMEPDEMVKEEVNRILQLIYQMLQKDKQREVLVAITYFKPDELKAGGRYETCRSYVKKIDSLQRMIIMQDETVISIDYIVEIEIINSEM